MSELFDETELSHWAERIWSSVEYRGSGSEQLAKFVEELISRQEGF